MITPQRAQRFRSKGFKMVHPNGLPNHYVGRPTPYGNCFKLENGIIYIDGSQRRQLSEKTWREVCPGDHQMVQDLFHAVFTGNIEYLNVDLSAVMIDVKCWIKHYESVDLQLIRGMNLYCFCPPFDQNGNKFPCHADVLIKLANPKEKE